MVRTKNTDWRMSAFLIELQNSFLFLSRTRKYECDAQKASSTLLAWVADDLCSSDESALPGVARQLLTFLASPRKVSKRRRPQKPGPCGVPSDVQWKMGATHNSLRSDKRHSFSISHCTSPAWLPCGPSNGSLRIALDERNCFAVFSDQFNYSPKLVMPPCCASSAMRSEQFCLSAYALLVMCCCDRKKRDACLS